MAFSTSQLNKSVFIKKIFIFFFLLLSIQGGFLYRCFSRAKCKVIQNWLQKMVTLEKIHSTYENSKHQIRCFHNINKLVCL